MTPFVMVSRFASAALIASCGVTAVLRVIGSHSWRSAFAIGLVMLGLRVVVMAWGVTRRELAWSRLLLPTILLLEGAGLAWHGQMELWQLRLATVLAIEVLFVVIALRELRRNSVGTERSEERLARALGALLPPRVARLAAFELVLVGSALQFVFGGWRRESPSGFTYHRESGLRMLIPVLPLLGIGDILLLELVLLPLAAMWVRVLVHGIAIYGLAWLVGLYASMRARPHQIVDGRLTLHRGLLRRLDVRVTEIASIEPLPSFADDCKKRAYTRGALRLDMAGPAVFEIQLHHPVRPIGVFGEEHAGTRVLVAVDDPVAFTAALRGE
ncbi:MAG: hypothetical protein ACTHU0_22450 [Kofleriaceae bacterium]